MNWWIEEYKKYHAEEETVYPGNNLKPQLHHIHGLVLDTRSESLLDYGCGKGFQYSKWKHHEAWGFMPALYDPAVPEHEHLPEGPFDGVYSTDVLEHIPEEQLPEVIHNIFSRAKKFVFLSICTKPAIAILPSGENAHCTVEPIGFWVNAVEKYAPKASRVYTHIKTYGNDNNYRILNEDIYLEWFVENLNIDGAKFTKVLAK